jgi:hypothetical protein
MDVGTFFTENGFDIYRIASQFWWMVFALPVAGSAILSRFRPGRTDDKDA